MRPPRFTLVVPGVWSPSLLSRLAVVKVALGETQAVEELSGGSVSRAAEAAADLGGVPHGAMLERQRPRHARLPVSISGRPDPP